MIAFFLQDFQTYFLDEKNTERMCKILLQLVLTVIWTNKNFLDISEHTCWTYLQHTCRTLTLKRIMLIDSYSLRFDIHSYSLRRKFRVDYV